MFETPQYVQNTALFIRIFTIENAQNIISENSRVSLGCQTGSKTVIEKTIRKTSTVPTTAYQMVIYLCCAGHAKVHNP